MRGHGAFRQSGKQQLDDAIHAHRRALARHHIGALPAYEQLLRYVQTRTALLHPTNSPKDHRGKLNDGLVALALYHSDWLRSVETWVPTQQNCYPQFASLAQHLFARFPVPACMTSVWFDLPLGERLPQHTWYKHLGLGQNIRTASLPMQLTRTMAHLFHQAPHHFSAVAALRWAQVRGMGGNEALARAVVGTRLGKILENEVFWETVLQFFVNQPSLDLAQVGPIVDFLQHQRFEWRDGVSPTGALGKQPPPQPDFTMRGRTTASLGRLVREWHRQLGQESQQPSIAWQRSAINEFQMVEGSEELGNVRIWTVSELLNSRALFLEGQSMRHCVATYVKSCIRRQTSIWSMQIEHQRGRHRVLTIEVDLLKRTICQARKKANQRPHEKEIAVMERWAKEQGLKVSDTAFLIDRDRKPVVDCCGSCL
jgi:hypothetical protein